ncbi:MAG: c-type cytochrome biogenesis protein CcsB [Euryarchaeota archaeon]|nr:c-type cytochrome biogenesis protein CcsB [Euryarchaeota archaeon]
MDIATYEQLGFEIALGTYLLSSILFILYVSMKKERLGSMGLTLAFFGFAFETIALANRWFYTGHPPWVTTYEVMAFFAWTLVGAYLILNFRSNYKSVGIIVAPLAFIIMGFSSMQSANPEPLVPALQSVWLLIHVPIVILAYGAFAVAFAASALYLWKDRKLIVGTKDLQNDQNPHDVPSSKHSQSGAGILTGLQLDALDDIAYKSVAIGFPLLTFGIITGAIWANRAWGSYWSWDPKETWSLVTWFVFLIYLHARTQNWSGRFAAYISVSGFLSVICTFLGVGYVLPFLESFFSVSTGMHGYAGGDTLTGTVLFCGVLGAVIVLLLTTRKRPPKTTKASSKDVATHAG